METCCRGLSHYALLHGKTWNKVPCTRIVVLPYFSQRSSFLSHPKCTTILWFTLTAHGNAHPTQPFLLRRRPRSETSALTSSRLRSYRHSSLTVCSKGSITTHTLFHVSTLSAELFWESAQSKALHCSSGEQGRLSTFQPRQAASALKKRKPPK